VVRQRKECGLDEVPFTLTENAVAHSSFIHYTKEAGVRSLEREIASGVPTKWRGKSSRMQAGDRLAIEIIAKMVPKYLGVPKFRLGKKEEKTRSPHHGLAVTQYGATCWPPR